MTAAIASQVIDCVNTTVYLVWPNADEPGSWVVESIGGKRPRDSAYFFGEAAEARAREYASFLHSDVDGSRAETMKLDMAFMLACRRIADGPQQYHEADTAAGWRLRVLKDAAQYSTSAATSPMQVEGRE